MPNILKALFGYLPVNIVSGLVSFGGVFIFTRLLGADDYGRYALAYSTLTLIHTFTLTWCEAAGYRFAAEAEAEGRMASHFRTSLTLAVVSLLPALIVLGVVVALVHANPGFQAAVCWLFILMPASVFINLALESHRAGQRVRRYSIVEIGRTLGGFVLGVGLAVVGGFGAAAPLIGMAIAFSIAALTEGFWLWQQSKGGKIEAHHIRRYAMYGLPISAALVLDLILSASDRFLIAFFIDEAAVGAYAAGYGVADKTTLMICAWAAMGLSPVVMRAFETEGKAAAEQAAKGLAQTLFLIAFPAAVGIALVADPLADVMIGPELRAQAKVIIPWIAFAGLLNGFLIHYFSEAFQLAKKTTLRALLMIIPAVANVVLNILLLPRMGLMGAVYATVGCYALAVVLLAVAGRRHVALPIPLGDLGRVLVGCLAMAGAVRLVPDMPAFFELLVKSGVGAIVFGLCVVSLDAAGAREMAGKVMRKVAGKLRRQDVVPSE